MAADRAVRVGVSAALILAALGGVKALLGHEPSAAATSAVASTAASGVPAAASGVPAAMAATVVPITATALLSVPQPTTVSGAAARQPATTPVTGPPASNQATAAPAPATVVATVAPAPATVAPAPATTATVAAGPLPAGDQTAATSGGHGAADLLDVSYGPDPLQRLDVHVPAASTLSPTVVYFHGGGWVGGDKATAEDMMIVGALVARGYAVASVNYRLAPAATFPAQLDDARLALAWVRGEGRLAGLDPGRLATFGVSAGGELVMLLAAERPGEMRAVVDWAGPMDLGRLRDDVLTTAGCGELFTDPEDPQSFYASFLGAVPSAAPEQVAAADPVSHLTGGVDPVVWPAVMIEHGSADCAVPVAQSRRLADGLRDAGIRDVVYRLVPGAGHGLDFPITAEAAVVADFLDLVAR